jgi:hypothetical protein
VHRGARHGAGHGGARTDRGGGASVFWRRLQRQGRPAGGAQRTDEGAAQGGLQGLGLAALAALGHGGALGRGARGRCAGVHKAQAGEGAGRRWRGSGSRRKSRRWAMQEGAMRVPAGGVQQRCSRRRTEGRRCSWWLAAASVRGCAGGGRAEARGKARAGHMRRKTRL